MISLRGHHLVCLHFFTGEGYDEVFIRNLHNTLAWADNEDIQITSGADDICTSCLHLKQERCEYTKDADADIREMDEKALDLLNLSGQGSARWEALRESVRTIFPEWHSLYCSECDWKGACEKHALFQEMVRNNSHLLQGGKQ